MSNKNTHRVIITFTDNSEFSLEIYWWTRDQQNVINFSREDGSFCLVNFNLIKSIDFSPIAEMEELK